VLGSKVLGSWRGTQDSVMLPSVGLLEWARMLGSQSGTRDSVKLPGVGLLECGTSVGLLYSVVELLCSYIVIVFSTLP